MRGGNARLVVCKVLRCVFGLLYYKGRDTKKDMKTFKTFKKKPAKAGKITKAILGKKIGMTQVFSDTGLRIPVTVVLATPNVVVQKKTIEKDGYNSVAFGFGEIRDKLVNRPKMGLFKKAGVKPVRHLREFRFVDIQPYEVGAQVKVDVFNVGDTIDVQGITRGRGFTGRIARWNMSRGPETHGSKHHRQMGSTGACSTPSRVFKGKKMPGHYGVERVTIQNLEIVKVDLDRNVLLIKGGIPGPKGSLVIVKNAVKGQKRPKQIQQKKK